jgi:hypothetical protein
MQKGAGRIGQHVGEVTRKGQRRLPGYVLTVGNAATRKQPARLFKGSEQAKLVQFDDAPGHHVFAAHAIDRRELALEDDDLDAVPGQDRCKGCARNSAADDGHVTGNWHASPL